jgi:hypothetical protein
MAEDQPYSGPNLGPLSPTGKPWGVKSVTPLPAEGGGWKPVATAPVPPVQAGPPQTGAPSSGGWIAKAMEPITSYPAEQRKQAGEAVQQMGEGISEMGTPGKRLGGALKTALGAGSYVSSPISAGLHTVVGKPLEENVGIPHQYSEFAAGLAIPGYGLSKTNIGQDAITAARNASQVLEKVASPETVDLAAKTAVASIRELSGQAARDTAKTQQALEPAWRMVNAMPDADRFNFIDYVEGRSTTYSQFSLRHPGLKDLADTLKDAFEQRMRKLQAMPSHTQMAFVEDYFPHFWKEPGAAANLTPGGGMSRQGSGASLKARTVLTIADGLAQGLTPVTTNPIEATMRYVTSMDRFIAAEEVLQTARNNGQVKFIFPKVMGASGHPNSFKVPDGWKPLQGRGSTNAAGAQAYAPEGFARIYNNWIGRGIAGINEDLGQAYEGARKASNAITAAELSFSGYHALTMMQESMVNSVANSIGYLRAGQPVEALKSAGKAAVAPVGTAMKGKTVQNVYLGLSPGSQEMQKITDLLTAAGGRAKGAEHAPDYNFSSAGSYWTAMKRGALRGQLSADRAEMMGAPFSGTTKVAFKHIGRVASTVAQPIFEKYIPLLKNGAFYENMSAWLSKNPTASREEQVKAARQVWDSIDNRFGELVQDNIFVDKTLKQIGMLSLRSWSWFIGGDVRELGGAARDVLRAPFKTPTGTGPYEGRWTTKMDYAIALPIVYGTLSAIYQGLKTGEPPQSLQDLIAPRTGGADAATGEPERLIMPGYMKDVFGFIEHPVDELTNKAATGPRMVKEIATNQNWRGDPIFPGKGVENAPNWLQAFWNYAGEQLGPISLRQIAKGKKAGSNLNVVESALGVRTAPRQLTDPEGFDAMMKNINQRKWKTKENYERRQQNLYEGE